MTDGSDNVSEKSGGLNGTMVLAIGGGLAALLFAGQQQLANNAGENTANLPATNERVASNAEDIKAIREQIRLDLDKLNERLAENIKSNAETFRDDMDKQNQSLSDQINRRETEMVKYIDGHFEIQQKHDDQLRQMITDVVRRFDQHQNNPPATHQHQSNTLKGNGH